MLPGTLCVQVRVTSALMKSEESFSDGTHTHPQLQCAKVEKSKEQVGEASGSQSLWDISKETRGLFGNQGLQPP